MAVVILSLGLLYFFAHLLAITFERTRVPDVLVLMGIGILVGPVLGLTSPEEFGAVGTVLTTVALAVILFESGTTLDLFEIARSARSTLLVSLATAGLTIVLLGVASRYAFGLPWLSAFLIGTIASGTSAAVVIPMVKSLKVRDSAGTLMILESAITDVTCIVFTFALLNAAAQGTMDLGRMVGQTLSALIFAAAIGIAGGVGWLLVWDRVRELPSSIFTTLAGAFVLYGFAEILGFAGAIAVLAFGITLTNHQHLRLARLLGRKRSLSGVKPSESEFYREIVFLLKTFFFVYLGINERIDDPARLAVVALLTLLLYLARLVVVPYLLAPTTTRREATIVAVMLPKGLAAAVLAGLPLQAGIAGGETIQAVVYGIVLVSILLTAVLVGVQGVPPFSTFFARVMERFPEAAPDTSPRGTPLKGIATPAAS